MTQNPGHRALAGKPEVIKSLSPHLGCSGRPYDRQGSNAGPQPRHSVRPPEGRARPAPTRAVCEALSGSPVPKHQELACPKT